MSKKINFINNFIRQNILLITGELILILMGILIAYNKIEEFTILFCGNMLGIFLGSINANQKYKTEGKHHE